jgi:hypothetical protein
MALASTEASMSITCGNAHRPGLLPPERGRHDHRGPSASHGALRGGHDATGQLAQLAQTLALATRDNDRYRAAMTCLPMRWLIVSPMSEGEPTPTGKRPRHAVIGMDMRQPPLLSGIFW